MLDAVALEKARDRLEARCIPEPNSGCLLWEGSTDNKGYGQMSIRGRGMSPYPAHRAAYQLACGAIPDGLFVLHSCDVPACCNPNHLRVGTHQDNMRDARERNRMRVPKASRGSRHHNAKLTEADVAAIRIDTRRQVDIAAEYGVPQTQISAIKNRLAWKHV